MLQELHLRDVGVIGEAGVDFSPGLNVVTGETGVGKTLLMTSLALLTGARTPSRLVRADAKEAIVQAVVSVPPRARVFLAGVGIEADDEMTIVRRISADGRSRAWIDGQLVPVSTLTSLGRCLVEIHGQGAGFALAQPAAQLAAVDALAGNGEVRDRYQEALGRWRALADEHAALATSEEARRRELDLLDYQIEEIERAQIEPDEDDRIGETLTRLEHAERLRALGEQALALAGAEGASAQLVEAHRMLQSAAAIDTSLATVVARLADVAAEASELARDVRAWTETLEADPAELERLHERKALLSTFKRKYGTTLDGVLSFVEGAKSRRDTLTNADARIAAARAEEDAAESDARRAASDLSKRRRKAAMELTDLVRAELPALALPNAMFEASVEETELGPDGADRVAFMFSSSKAHELNAIGKIASGGELSRAMIAVTLALARSHDVPVLVFDEADQGVGGEAALELGRRLARLAQGHQVLVVSHLPQLAAFADRHIVIRREGDDVSVETLNRSGRVAEISRMLAGLESSSRARAHAGELLDLAAAERDDRTEAAAG